MKILLIAITMILTLPYYSHANEVVLSCKLKALDEMQDEGVLITGIFTIEKIAEGKLVMKADAVVVSEGDEPEDLLVEDNVALYELKDETTIPNAETYVASDDNLSAIRDHLLTGQTIAKFELYNGQNFQEDGAGLNLFKYQTKEGETLTMVNVGWSFLLCE